MTWTSGTSRASSAEHRHDGLLLSASGCCPVASFTVRWQRWYVHIDAATGRVIWTVLYLALAVPPGSLHVLLCDASIDHPIPDIQWTFDSNNGIIEELWNTDGWQEYELAFQPYIKSGCKLLLFNYFADAYKHTSKRNYKLTGLYMSLAGDKKVSTCSYSCSLFWDFVCEVLH